MNLPLDQRHIDFVAFDNLLTATAIGLSWMQGAAAPSLTEGITSIDALLNMALPYLALEGMIGTASSTISKATNFLDNIGANYRSKISKKILYALQEKGWLNWRACSQMSRNRNQQPMGLHNGQLNYQRSALSLTVYMQERILRIIGVTLTAMATLSAALSLLQILDSKLIFSVGAKFHWLKHKQQRSWRYRPSNRSLELGNQRRSLKPIDP